MVRIITSFLKVRFLTQTAPKLETGGK